MPYIYSWVSKEEKKQLIELCKELNESEYQFVKVATLERIRKFHGILWRAHKALMKEL